MAKDVARAGDANSDGTFDDADIALLMEMIQGKAPKNNTADCNSDGEINVQDMACVNNKRGQTGFDRVLFVYDEAGRLIGEYLKNGASFTTLKEYIWLGDLPVAVIENDTLYHVYADHLNTPRAITTAGGTLVWSWHSDAYGYVPPEQDADGDGVLFTYNLRFPGQYFDVETGLFYNWHRNYDPMTGRYLEADPIGLDGGLNLYGYVGGNPVGLTDFLGLDANRLDPKSGQYLPHTHLYPSGQPSTEPRDLGMLDPTDFVNHYRQPGCLRCSNLANAKISAKLGPMGADLAGCLGPNPSPLKIANCVSAISGGSDVFWILMTEGHL